MAVTKKDIRKLVEYGAATEVTDEAWLTSHNYDRVFTAHGRCSAVAILVVDNDDGKCYAVFGSLCTMVRY